MRRFRSIRSKLGPPWLVELGDSGKVAHTLAGICDAFLERVRLGLEARFPSRAGDSALALLGRDRLLPRGLRERAESYADRLKQWRYPYGHRVRGSAFALLDQIAAYLGSVLTAVVEGGVTTYAPASAPVSTVDAHGTVFTRDRFGGQTVTRGGSWTWDSQPASNWSRFWVVLDASGIVSVAAAPARTTIAATNPQAYPVSVGVGDFEWSLTNGDTASNYTAETIPAGGTIDLPIETASTGAAATLSDALFFVLLSPNPDAIEFWYGGVAEVFGAAEQYVEGSRVATPCPDSEDPLFWSNADQAYGLDTLPASGAQALRDLVSGRGAWKPAGTRPEWLIVAFAGSAPTPDATWATWAKYVDGLGYDQIEPSRSGDYRYISLSPEQNNTYAGDPDRYPLVFAVLGLEGPDRMSPYGDSSSYPATIAMPDDSTYTGNPATFPSPIQMIDDGAPVP